MYKNLRNEKKFIFYSSSKSIEKFIESLGAEYLYPERKINSIYFDSIYFKDFYQASEGIYSRSKTRVRWYNNTFNAEIHPSLEIKVKKGNQKILNLVLIDQYLIIVFHYAEFQMMDLLLYL